MLDFLIFATFVALLVIPCVIANRKRAEHDQDEDDNGTIGLVDHSAFPGPKTRIVNERRPRLAARHVDPTTARAGGVTAKTRSQIR